MSKAMTPSRSENWLIRFDPAVGDEIRKTRPAVVVNTDDVGGLALRLVVPLTDWKPHYAGFSWFTFVPANAGNGLSKDSAADAFQIKSISLSRFVRRLGIVTDLEIESIADSVAICVGTD